MCKISTFSQPPPLFKHCSCIQSFLHKEWSFDHVVFYSKPDQGISPSFTQLLRLGALDIMSASGPEMVLEATEAAFPYHSHSLEQKGQEYTQQWVMKEISKKSKSMPEHDKSDVS